jgi:Spx/MgsR family transcriptional regulator
MYVVYGIPNCNTVKKAIDWLKDHQIAFSFHDYKKQGITAAVLNNWADQVGWETLVNKRGTTWKLLSPEIQQSITTQKKAVSLLLEKTSAIKRPLIEKDGKVITLGFDTIEYATVFKTA